VIAALYTSGKLVTGCCHGEAFGKLSQKEQDSHIHSGFLDPQKLKFISDDCEFYLKQIILMRHGDSEGKQESGITERGRSQVKMAAAFFASMDLNGYTGFCSPLRRCVETASLLEDYCHIHFSIDKALIKQDDDEENETFIHRVGHVLDKLPEKSLLISHCDFIKVMAQLAVNDVELPDVIPNCSTTFIDNHRVIWIARECNNANGVYDKERHIPCQVSQRT
jgi:broad specificity phosphatase PhoE